MVALLTLGFNNKIYSQRQISKIPYHLAPSIGVSGQSQTFFDININLFRIDTNQTKLLLNKSFKLGLELNSNGDNFIWGPKIGYEIAGTTIIRLSAINYFEKSKIDPRILPEIGLSLCGAISVLYGYNIPITDYNSPSIGAHKLSVCVLLDPKYWKRLGIL